jgi:hypothetical protein
MTANDHRLLRLVGNDEVASSVRQSNATGKSLKNLSIPSHKNIPLAPSGKSVINSARLTQSRGDRDRHERAVGCGGRESHN